MVSALVGVQDQAQKLATARLAVVVLAAPEALALAAAAVAAVSSLAALLIGIAQVLVA